MRVLAGVFALVLCSGCATITSNEMQPVSVMAKDATGVALDKVNCNLKNDKGNWEVSAPNFVNVRRSAEDLIVECKKEGQPDGFLRAISRAAGGMFGNIVFGGGIGAIIDHNKGTGYNYPDALPVIMGKSVVIDRRDHKPDEADSSQPKVSAVQ